MNLYDAVMYNYEREGGRGRPSLHKQVIKHCLEDLEDICEKVEVMIFYSVNAYHFSSEDLRMLNLDRKVGTYVLNRVFDDLPETVQLKLENNLDDSIFKVGSFFVASSHGRDYCEIKRQFMTGRGKEAEGYFIFPGDNFVHEDPKKIEVPLYTSDTKIPDISKLRQGNGLSVIKGWSGMEAAEEFKMFLDNDEDPGNPEAFIQAANQLQQTPWQINREVLEIIKANHLDKYLTEPELPDSPTAQEELYYLSEMSKVNEAKVILRKAETFAQFLEFYQYVSFCWRGRVYYSEPYLNFQGPELARGLLTFGEAKPLGDRGEYWLAIHTANSFNMSYKLDDLPDWLTHDYRAEYEAKGLSDISVDKMHLDDRYLWTMNYMDEIEITALMGGLPDCEKPVAYLAACLEWVKVNSCESKKWHFCSLPIGVDGSNNGWQHLGAMLKDRDTGDLVGLTTREIPNDLYVSVAQRLMELEPEYFEKHPMPTKAVRKGLAKRGTMTKAYSAGEAAIAENMWKDVWQYGFDKKYGITEEDCVQLAKSLVKAIRDVCSRPIAAMETFQEIAKVKMDSGENEVRWQSPSGFPVTQHYDWTVDRKSWLSIAPPPNHNHHLSEIGSPIYEDGKVSGYDGYIGMIVKYSNGSPDKQKHAKSISPNFVHSQDAAHLALTVANWGGSFGAVHDSFSVHACDIDDLLDLTKSVFVHMYDEDDFLANLAEEFGVDIKTPDLGDLDITEVMQSHYFFA